MIKDLRGLRTHQGLIAERKYLRRRSEQLECLLELAKRKRRQWRRWCAADQQCQRDLPESVRK